MTVKHIKHLLTSGYNISFCASELSKYRLNSDEIGDIILQAYSELQQC